MYNMDCLVMQWDYEYDKEGTWLDHDCGEEIYELKEGISYPLPHISKKTIDVLSVTKDGDIIQAELHVDHHRLTVLSVGDPVTAHASYDYSAGGDSVSQSLSLKLTIERR